MCCLYKLLGCAVCTEFGECALCTKLGGCSVCSSFMALQFVQAWLHVFEFVFCVLSVMM